MRAFSPPYSLCIGLVPDGRTDCSWFQDVDLWTVWAVGVCVCVSWWRRQESTVQGTWWCEQAESGRLTASDLSICPGRTSRRNEALLACWGHLCKICDPPRCTENLYVTRYHGEGISQATASVSDGHLLWPTVRNPISAHPLVRCGHMTNVIKDNISVPCVRPSVRPMRSSTCAL